VRYAFLCLRDFLLLLLRILQRSLYEGTVQDLDLGEFAATAGTIQCGLPVVALFPKRL